MFSTTKNTLAVALAFALLASLHAPAVFALRGEALREDPETLREVELALGVPVTASLAPPAPATSVPAIPPAPPTLPPHWSPAWPVPTAEELAHVDTVLETVIETMGQNRMSGMNAGAAFALLPEAVRLKARRTTSYFDAARILRAIYYQYPDVAGALITSFGTADHGRWKEIVSPLRPLNEPGPVEASLLGGMMARGFSLWQDETVPMFRGQPFQTGYDLQGPLGLMGYVRHSEAMEIIHAVPDEHLPTLIEWMIAYAKGGHFAANILKGIRAALLDIPERRLAQVRLSAETLKLFDEWRCDLFPASSPLPRVEKAIPSVVSRGVGRLIVLRDAEPSHELLRSLPHDAIVAMEWMPTSHVDIGPFRGLLTFLKEDETSHAKARSEAWGVPHALWPGVNEELRALENKVVVLQVTKDVVTLRAAKSEELGEQGERMLSHVTLPPVDLDGTEDYLDVGHPDMKRPEVVGHKIAGLNQWVARPPTVSDPQIHVELATGAAIPFAAFVRALERTGGRARFHALLDEAVALRDAGDEEGAAMRLAELWTWVEEARIELNVPWEQVQRLAPAGVFVRAATNAEDLPDHPGVGSGLYKTVPNVRDEIDFLNALDEVMESVWYPTAFQGRGLYRIDERTVYPAVWLVPAVPGEYAFVLSKDWASRW